MHIYPSVLEPNIKSLISYFPQIYPHFDHFQIDIADGKYVPDKTATLKEIITAVKEKRISLKNKTAEFHLMEENPAEDIALLNENAEMLNLTSIIFHLQPYQNNPSLSPLTSQLKFGLSLNPNESIKTHWKTIKSFPIIQLMTIVPGKQGTPFIPDVLDKITELRELEYKGRIILDGAMNDTTLPIVLSKKYLPDAICPGSYFKENTKERLECLQTLLPSISPNTTAVLP